MKLKCSYQFVISLTLKSILCFVAWVSFWWVFLSIPLNIRYIVLVDELPTRLPSIISEMICGGVMHPHSETLEDAEFIMIHYAGVFKYNSQLAIVHGYIVADDIVYEYFLPARRIPFTNRFALQRRHNLIMSSSSLDAIAAIISPSFLVNQFPGLWNTLIVFDRTTNTVDGWIRPPNLSIIVGGLSCSLFCISRGRRKFLILRNQVKKLNHTESGD